MLKHHLFKAEQPTDKYIVLLHGFGGNHRVWKHQIPLLKRYYNVLAIDLPSHNTPNLKLSQIKVSLDSVAREIIAVCDFYQIKNAGFMGVSIGTIFIKYIEAYYPEYVSFAVLVGAVATVNKVFCKIVDIFEKIGHKLPFSVVYYIFSWVLMPGENNRESREIFRKCAVALNRKEFKLYMKIFNQGFRFSRRFEHMNHAENVYISGDEDNVFLKGAMHEMKGSKGKVILMKKCGHVCNIARKKRFNRIIMPVLFRKFSSIHNSEL